MKNIFTTILLAAISFANAQVIIGDAVGTAAVKTSVLLEFAAKQNKGIILPYVRELPAGAALVGGAIVLDATDSENARVRFYNGTAWQDLSGQNADLTTPINYMSAQPTIAAAPEASTTRAIIGAQSSTADGVLVLESTTKAMVLPIVENVQDVPNPSPGMMVYVNKTGSKRLAVYNGSKWSFWGANSGRGFNEVTSLTGRVWMDRNLGAAQVATSPTDALSYGDLYQWGRGADGHEKRTSEITTVLSGTNSPGHGDFIVSGNQPFDWRSPQNITLWQGVNGNNNPCPTGFRLPTAIEMDVEIESWSSRDSAGAFASPLRLPLSGLRAVHDGALDYVGRAGFLWTSDVSGSDSFYYVFFNTVADIPNFRASGISVRCIKD